jgi:L-lactate dehydrogenase complex protein LldF
MAIQPIDQFAADLSEEVRASVLAASRKKVIGRQNALFGDYPDANALRRQAGLLKQHTLEHLDEYLEQAAARMEANGVKVHFAADEESARAQILAIYQEAGVTAVTKSKSMVTEEIELRPYLEEHGIATVETDLGEFIVQLDDDHPSHIVTPIIHKNRRQIARTFEEHGLGDYNDDPETITRRARTHLRGKYLAATGTMTGANFVSAESGRLVIVTNEGNSRFGMAGGKVHVAVVGIEKLVPTDRDLTLYLNLLARSSTGQHLTVYTEFVSGPKASSQPEGPEEMHVVFVDNGRTETLASDCAEALRCIRCGACLNVCPIFRQASGHAYRHTYPGPIGAVLAPNLVGDKRFPELADLPKASSLCGACNEVCPVDIPIPDLLLRLRNRGKQRHAAKSSINAPGLKPWATMASSPGLWKAALKGGHVMNILPEKLMLHPSAQAWLKARTLPKWQGGEFRKWMKQRGKGDPA